MYCLHIICGLCTNIQLFLHTCQVWSLHNLQTVSPLQKDYFFHDTRQKPCNIPYYPLILYLLEDALPQINQKPSLSIQLFLKDIPVRFKSMEYRIMASADSPLNSSPSTNISGTFRKLNRSASRL